MNDSTMCVTSSVVQRLHTKYKREIDFQTKAIQEVAARERLAHKENTTSSEFKV